MSYQYVHFLLVYRIQLNVDDEQVATGQLPFSGSEIDSMPGEAGGLYIGGVPKDLAAAEGTAATLQPFRGCISDIIITEK